MAFAAFVIALAPGGHIAAVTRPDGGIGLPGGKVERGESPAEAAIREAGEEGWDLLVGGGSELKDYQLRAIHSQLIEGRPVVWFATPKNCLARRRWGWKEMGRVQPIAVEPSTLLLGGDALGNASAMARWVDHTLGHGK